MLLSTQGDHQSPSAFLPFCNCWKALDSASSLASTTESDIMIDGGGKEKQKQKKKLKRD
jgi:hypothetical protein